MKKMILLVLLCLTLVGVGEVEAKSVTWSSGSQNYNMAYFWNRAPIYTTDTVPLSTTPSCSLGANGCGWGVGLYSGFSVQVTYKAKLFNAATGKEILDGTTIPVETVVRVARDLTTKNTDVSWIGTGQSIDSPYGYWVTGAGPLSNACLAQDSIFNGAGMIEMILLDPYVLLSVAPPVETVSSSNTNARCSGNLCTIQNAGPLSLRINFQDTFGRFYYRYSDARTEFGGGCHANNVPMRQTTLSKGLGFCVGISCETGPEILPIPEQVISFNLIGAGNNNAPNAPVITPQPYSGLINIAHPFTFTATDPDNHQVRYQIDWNNDGVTDRTVPATGYVNSGTAQTSSSYPWNTPGINTFRARTQDSQGGVSGWTTATAVLTIPATPTVVTNPAVGGTLYGTGNPNGTAATGWFRYSTTDPTTCNDIFGTRLPATGGTALGAGNMAVAFNQALTTTSGTTYYYCAIASNSGGTGYGMVRTFTTAPATPTGPLAIPDPTCGTGVVTLSWSPTAGATSYDIERDGAYTTVMSTTYTHSGLAAGSSHSYRVRANNVGGSSTWSALQIATAPAACPAPDLVSQNLSAEGGPYYVGTPFAISAQVRNQGPVTTGAGFSDDFTYRYGGSGAWLPFANNVIAQSVLAPTQVATDNASFTPSQARSDLYLQHCVDATHVIIEGTSETPNCTTIGPLTVALPPPYVEPLAIGGCSDGIPYGASTCMGYVTWTFYNVVAPNNYLVQKKNSAVVNETVDTTVSGNNVPSMLERGDNTVTAIANGATLRSTIRTIECQSGSVWSDGICFPPPTLSVIATPALVRSGDSTQVQVTVQSAHDLTCTLRNATTDSPKSFTHSGTIAADETYPFTTKALTATQLVTVTCLDAATGLSGTAEIRIEVLPTVEEI
jgi:hypothetical protein